MAKKPFWEKASPAKKPTKLSDLQKAAAKRRASEAGRPYPNLIDNAWAANKKA